MKRLILIRGVSGSGKSTLADELESLYISYFNDIESDLTVVRIETDMFWYLDDEDIYAFDASKLGEAHLWCKETVLGFMEYGVDYIIVSNTFTTEKELEPYLVLAKDYGYIVTSLVVENRHGNTDVHNVPENIKQKQATRLKNNLKLM